jgi:hypothetical protein
VARWRLPGSAGGDARRYHVEVLPGIGDDLAIARMIGRLDSHDPLADRGVFLTQMFGKFALGAGRANDQDLAGSPSAFAISSKKFVSGLACPLPIALAL